MLSTLPSHSNSPMHTLVVLSMKAILLSMPSISMSPCLIVEMWYLILKFGILGKDRMVMVSKLNDLNSTSSS